MDTISRDNLNSLLRFTPGGVSLRDKSATHARSRNSEMTPKWRNAPLIFAPLSGVTHAENLP